MQTHKATRVSITTEKLIQDGVIQILEDAGAPGFFVFEGDGKGVDQQELRRHHPIVDDFAIVKIEAVVAERRLGEQIADRIAAQYFEHHSGIVYLDEVEVLRPAKFAGRVPGPA